MTGQRQMTRMWGEVQAMQAPRLCNVNPDSSLVRMQTSTITLEDNLEVSYKTIQTFAIEYNHYTTRYSPKQVKNVTSMQQSAHDGL